MPRIYRALISVPVEADDDNAAQNVAAELAGPNGFVEFIGETSDGMHIDRVVNADPHFIKQLPADWRP